MDKLNITKKDFSDYKILKELATTPKKMISSNVYNNLKNKGIISVKSKDISYIPIGFLNDFLLGEIADSKGMKQSLPESYTLMKSITNTIELINKQRLNHKKSLPFPPVVDGATLEEDLRTPCYTKEQVSVFSSALYKYYYERLKESRDEFSYFLFGTKFGKCVDAARHSLGGGHEMDFFVEINGHYSHTDMLMEVMGSADELSSMEEYHRFQIEMLKRFKLTVEKMLTTVKGK